MSAFSHSTADLGSLNGLLNCVGELKAMSGDALAGLVVATDVVVTDEFKFPRSVPREFEMDATDPVADLVSAVDEELFIAGWEGLVGIVRPGRSR